MNTHNRKATASDRRLIKFIYNLTINTKDDNLIILHHTLGQLSCDYYGIGKYFIEQ